MVCLAEQPAGGAGAAGRGGGGEGVPAARKYEREGPAVVGAAVHDPVAGGVLRGRRDGGGDGVERPAAVPEGAGLPQGGFAVRAGVPRAERAVLPAQQRGRGPDLLE